MKTAGTLLAILTLTAAFASPQSNAKKADSPKPIRALEWLVGGVWTADVSAMGNGMQRIETRYQWSDNNSFVRFNTHFISDKGVSRTYDGNLFWSPAIKSLAIWYMNADNDIIEGPIQIDGDNWTITFRGYDFDGKMADLRAEITRKSPDLYHWLVREKQPDSTWKEMMALDYRRVAGS